MEHGARDPEPSCITVDCQCHEAKRTTQFSSSLEQPLCWCGLVQDYSSQNGEVKAPSSGNGFVPQVPLILNAKFWKIRWKDFLQHCSEVQNVVHGAPDDNCYLYFLSHYLVGATVGRGTFSKARKGLRRNPETSVWKPVALKFYYRGACARKRTPQFERDGSVTLLSRWDKIKAEIVLYSTLNHPNIPKLLELLYNPLHDVWVVAMEYGPQHALIYDTRLQLYRCPSSTNEERSRAGIGIHPKILSEHGAREVMKQIVSVTNYLHESHCIIHKDIKPENLLLSGAPPADWIRWRDYMGSTVTEQTVDTSSFEITNGGSSSEVFGYDNLSDTTEEFLWIEGEIDGCGTYTRQPEEIAQWESEMKGKHRSQEKAIPNTSIREIEHDIERFGQGESSTRFSSERVALSMHLKLNDHKLSIGEKVGLLNSSNFPKNIVTGLEPLKYHRKASGNSIELSNTRGIVGGTEGRHELASRGMEEDLWRNEVHTSVWKLLMCPAISNLYCFCCGMHLTESAIRANHQWEFEGDDDAENETSYQNTTEEHFSNIQGVHKNSIGSVYLRDRCSCCRRAIESVDSFQGILSTPRRPEETGPNVVMIKLIDFNSAVQASPPELYIYDSEGSRHFTPPECFEQHRPFLLGRPRDVWSIGCLLYSLVCGDLPFKSDTLIGVSLEIQRSSLTFPKMNEPLSNHLTNLITRLLDKDPTKRMTLSEILDHPWMQSDT